MTKRLEIEKKRKAVLKELFKPGVEAVEHVGKRKNHYYKPVKKKRPPRTRERKVRRPILIAKRHEDSEYDELSQNVKHLLTKDVLKKNQWATTASKMRKAGLKHSPSVIKATDYDEVEEPLLVEPDTKRKNSGTPKRRNRWATVKNMKRALPGAFNPNLIHPRHESSIIPIIFDSESESLESDREFERGKKAKIKNRWNKVSKMNKIVSRSPHHSKNKTSQKSDRLSSVRRESLFKSKRNSLQSAKKQIAKIMKMQKFFEGSRSPSRTHEQNEGSKSSRSRSTTHDQSEGSILSDLSESVGSVKSTQRNRWKNLRHLNKLMAEVHKSKRSTMNKSRKSLMNESKRSTTNKSRSRSVDSRRSVADGRVGKKQKSGSKPMKTFSQILEDLEYNAMLPSFWHCRPIWRTHIVPKLAASCGGGIVTRSQSCFNRIRPTLSNLELCANLQKHHVPGKVHLMSVLKGLHGNIPNTIITRSIGKSLRRSEKIEDKLKLYKNKMGERKAWKLKRLNILRQMMFHHLQHH